MENLLSSHLDIPFYREKKSNVVSDTLRRPVAAPADSVTKNPIRSSGAVATDATAPSSVITSPVSPKTPSRVLTDVRLRNEYYKNRTVVQSPPPVIIISTDGSINGIPTVTAQAPVMGIPIANAADKSTSGGGGGGSAASSSEEASTEGISPVNSGWFGMNPTQMKITKGLGITLAIVAAWKYGLFGKLKTAIK